MIKIPYEGWAKIFTVRKLSPDTNPPNAVESGLRRSTAYVVVLSYCYVKLRESFTSVFRNISEYTGEEHSGEEHSCEEHSGEEHSCEE